MRRIIDISVSLQAGIPSDPPGLTPKIEYFAHADTADALLAMVPGATRDDLPDGEGWAHELVRATTHNGTHLDAPYHYSAVMNGGEKAMTIDQVPLDWCFQPGVKLDFRHLPDGYVATADDVETELRRIGHELAPLEIVIVNTAAGMRYGRDDYVSAGCGMGRDATRYILDKGVRLTGTDAWSWDAPFVHVAARFSESRDPSIIWEGHRVGREIGYCHLEKLHHLETLPPTGFEVSCFPVKVAAASAGWTRAVAIMDEPS